ncbi:hypothetical protein [Iodobacter fluviatilis]|uniref:Uncharacterized protein n=1 Tax=Iodobacter fluviatilis TaxID=537 RepID=A0A377SRQ7_9NEIS|nr:hypothetical protein [Iodobacter fluviatilis]TCU86311.1 hypothetical protein EV682_106199 [Iodobacter fluviatilis]STR44722.1 Uncharacterised protein [Iodobacter fluviatilis]
MRYFLAVFALMATFAQAETTGPDGMTTAQLGEFLKSLQTAVAKDDASSVAKLARFPLRVNLPKKKTLQAQQFIAQYSKVITPKVKAAVLAQTAESLFRNSNGAMIGNGEIWFSGLCLNKECTKQTTKMIAINP